MEGGRGRDRLVCLVVDCVIFGILLLTVEDSWLLSCFAVLWPWAQCLKGRVRSEGCHRMVFFHCLDRFAVTGMNLSMV